jgi:hypothetical protein
MSQEERARRVNREAYFQIWGEAPPGDIPTVVDASPRAVSEAPRPKDLKDQTLARLINDLEVLTKRMDSVFNTLKVALERVEQAQLSERDELKALSRRLGVSLERRRVSEASKRSGAPDRVRTPRGASSSEKPPSFFAVSVPSVGFRSSRTVSLILGLAVGGFVLLVTALFGLGSSGSTGFAITGVNVLLGLGFALVSLGILLRQRARRKVRRRPPG